MTKRLPIIPSTALLAALLLSSCGKQEAVGDVPSSEELAKQADAATAAIRAEEEAQNGADAGDTAVDSSAMTSYTNALRGYTVLLPKGWELDEEASDDNGRTYRNEGSSFTVGWTENREDADIKAAVDAVEGAGESMTGAYASDDDYRASGSESGGAQSSLRILRKPDGTMVRAKITYPADQAEKMDAIAKQILDSLTLQ